MTRPPDKAKTWYPSSRENSRDQFPGIKRDRVEVDETKPSTSHHIYEKIIWNAGVYADLDNNDTILKWIAPSSSRLFRQCIRLWLLNEIISRQGLWLDIDSVGFTSEGENQNTRTFVASTNHSKYSILYSVPTLKLQTLYSHCFGYYEKHSLEFTSIIIIRFIKWLNNDFSISITFYSYM